MLSNDPSRFVSSYLKINRFSRTVRISMEEDFLTWKDKFWPAVLDFFGMEMKLLDISMRQYKLVVPEVAADKVFTGEIARLRAYQTQRP